MDEHLTKIFNALCIYCHNMRTLHWKTRGLDFDAKHELVDEYRKQMGEYIDDIAEIMLMCNINPPTLVDVVKSAAKDSKERYIILSTDKYYDNKEIFEQVNKMFAHLVELYTKVTKSSALSGDIVGKLEEHQYFFHKEYKYKGVNRLK